MGPQKARLVAWGVYFVVGSSHKALIGFKRWRQRVSRTYSRIRDRCVDEGRNANKEEIRKKDRNCRGDIMPKPWCPIIVIRQTTVFIQAIEPYE